MRVPLSLFLLLTLSACGFKLVGSGSWPAELNRVHVDMSLGYRVAEPPIQTALRGKLLRRGATIVAKPGDGDTLIRLSDFTERRETLSIGSDGKALEYRLVIAVRYEVLRDGAALLPANTLSVSRDYSFSLDQILQKELEEEQLREYIQNELAELLLLRITTGLKEVAVVTPPAQLVPPLPSATPAP